MEEVKISDAIMRYEPKRGRLFGRWKVFESAECWEWYVSGRPYEPVWEPGIFGQVEVWK